MIAGRKIIITSIEIIAPLAKNIHIVDTISIFEYIPTPIVAAKNDRADVTIDFAVSFVATARASFLSFLFLYSNKNLSVISIE